MNTLIYLPFIAFVAAAISFTISVTRMFKSFRETISPWHKKIEELIHCPWCLGHWVVFIIFWCLPRTFIWQVLESNQLWVHNSYVLRSFNFLFTSFIVIGMMGLIHYVLLRAYEPVAKAMAARTLELLQKKNKQK